MSKQFKQRRGEHKNIRAKERNKARKEFRARHPEYRGSQLHCWPLPSVNG